MKHLLADTLFKRLFLLMWVALVLSHVVGFWVVQAVGGGPDVVIHDAGPPPLRAGGPGLDIGPGDEPGPPPFPSRGDGADPPTIVFSPAPLPGARFLWLDYLVRFLIVAIAAWVGARWLAGPMRRLAGASRAVAAALSRQRRPAPLDESLGTLEVQQTAAVFNDMASQLHEQFEARGLMMAAISHDLRTPLARLRLRLEQLDPGALKDRCVADVQEADHMISSVLNTLRLSHQASAPQRVDMRALLQSLADDGVDQGQAVSFEFLPLEHPAVVLADTSDLQRVVGNLVGNAVRHGGSARVSLAEAGDRLLVRVDDDGPGIPEDELESVFQPFYRVDASRSRQTGGTGLGLYIARDLARRHGGELSLSNRREGGLRAELSLPRAV
jgi:signal transduction histidine kinase